MRMNLSIAYWGLLLISLISSCLLFIIVASEATKSSEKAVYGHDVESKDNENFKETVIENADAGEFVNSGVVPKVSSENVQVNSFNDKQEIDQHRNSDETSSSAQHDKQESKCSMDTLVYFL